MLEKVELLFGASDFLFGEGVFILVYGVELKNLYVLQSILPIFIGCLESLIVYIHLHNYKPKS